MRSFLSSKNRLFLIFIFILLVGGCSGATGEGDSTEASDSSGASKLYIGGDTSAKAMVGVVATDDLGRTMVGITNTEGGSDLAMVIVNVPGGVVKIWVSVARAGIPTGMPYSAEFEDGSSLTFSAYTSSTMDITLTKTDGTTTTITGVDISGMTARTTLTEPYLTMSPSANRQALGAWEFTRLTFSVMRIGLCPASIAIGFASGGWGLPFAIAGCAIAIDAVVGLTTSNKELHDKAYTNISPTDCTFEQIAAGQVKDCALDTASLVKANGIYIQLDGTVFKEGDSIYRGSIGGSWRATGDCEGLADGTFIMNIASDGAITGTYTGSDSGSITGLVDNTGTFSSGSGGATGGGWSGSFTRNGGDLSGSGTWSAFDCSGTWSGTGSATQ